MPPKREGQALTSKKAKKMPKLMKDQVNNDAEVKKTSKNVEPINTMTASQIQELGRVLALIKKIVKSSDLPPNFKNHLLEFSNKVIGNHHCNDLKTPEWLEGGRLLWKAVNAGDTVTACLLVRAGANLNFRDPEDNCTPLHQVLRCHNILNNVKREELAQLMLNYGADVNARDAKGYSVLHDAIRLNNCSTELVEELLKRGAGLTFGGETCVDDICSAAQNKPELLPKLIEHQVADSETLNKRVLFALEELIYRQPNPVVLRVMKKILNIGVPVNSVYARGKGVPCSLLSIALSYKRREAIKLLLDYGADPHKKNSNGETPLFQATKFIGFTHTSRLLIEKGASIHAPNADRRYPIHGVCLHGSLRNAHLFLSLGADLNVTDYKGRTPYSYRTIVCIHYLFIKHFALIIAKGGTLNDEDMARVNENEWADNHFNKCTEQLQRMKAEEICGGVSYFSLFTESMGSMLRLMKNPAFAKNFKRSSKRRGKIFPDYFYMLLHSFEIAEMRYEILLEKKRYVTEAFNGVLPDLIVEKIACYSCFEKLKQCQYDYYMSLHKSLKNSKEENEKIQ